MYDFRKMSEKDVFQARLKHEVINFGFIPVWRFGRFVRFCKKHGLLYKPPTYVSGAHLVKHNFSYLRTFSNIGHLPLGKLSAWIADIFDSPVFAVDGRSYTCGKSTWKYAYRETCVVKPRGTREGFTYVIATRAGISI